MTTSLEVAAQLAGLTEHKLGSAIRGAAWWLPSECHLTHGNIHWAGALDTYFDGSIDATEGLLGSFLALKDAPDESLAEFARRHGVLCAFRDPTHQIVDFSNGQFSNDPEFDDSDRVETIVEWRQTIDLVELILRCFIKTRQGDATSVFDAVMGSRFWPDGSPRKTGEAEAMLALLPDFLGAARPVRYPSNDSDDWLDSIAERVVNSMLAAGGTNYTVNASRDFLPVLGPRSLLAALGLQLASVLANSALVAACSECQALFRPKRKPASGRRTYCPDCREGGASVRHASADYRARGRGDAQERKTVQPLKGIDAGSRCQQFGGCMVESLFPVQAAEEV